MRRCKKELKTEVIAFFSFAPRVLGEKKINTYGNTSLILEFLGKYTSYQRKRVTSDI